MKGSVLAAGSLLDGPDNPSKVLVAKTKRKMLLLAMFHPL